MRSDRLYCFISIYELGSLKNPFATITSLPELYFRFRRFTLLVQTKKGISISYDSSTRSWKTWRWVRLELIFTMRIYISSNLNPLTKFTSSSRYTEFKDILSWSISQIITKTVPSSTKIVKSCAIKRGIPFGIWWKVNGNWENMINGGNEEKAIAEQILASEVRNKSKEQDCESYRHGPEWES